MSGTMSGTVSGTVSGTMSGTMYSWSWSWLWLARLGKVFWRRRAKAHPPARKNPLRRTGLVC